MPLASGATPRVTIGLPVYNGAGLMRRAIDSILAQTYTDIELLISDNCSTDETPDICREYARADPRVVYTRTDRNLGAAGNYTRLARLARGEYFKWISHDDWMAPGFVEACLSVAEGSPDIVTVAPVVEIVDGNGVVVQSAASYTGRAQWSADRLKQYREMMEELAYCETHGDGLLMIVYEYGFHRTALLRKTRLVMPFISSDYVLAAELALFGRLVRIPEALSRFTLSTAATGTTANFTSWNAAAIQRMLAPSRTGKLDLLLSVRQRHFEQIRAVLRSPLSPPDKLRALGTATLPARTRFGVRLRPRRHRTGVATGSPRRTSA